MFTVYVDACTWPQASLPDMGKKYSVLLKKVPCMCFSPPSPSCYVMVLLMAGIIIGPVYASLKIWFRTPTVCGIYVTEENRRGVWITSCFYDSPQPMWQRGRARRKDPYLSKKRVGGSCVHVWECWEKDRESNGRGVEEVEVSQLHYNAHFRCPWKGHLQRNFLSSTAYFYKLWFIFS